MRVHDEQCTLEQFKLAFELLMENCVIADNNKTIVIQEPTPELLANFIRLVKATR